MRAAVYARLSRVEVDEQGRVEQQANLDDQVRRGREEAARRGWEVVEEIVDAGRSGAREVGRPGIERVIDLVEQQAIDAVVVRDLDRLWRDHSKAWTFKDTCHVVGYSDGTDTTQPGYELPYGVRSLLAAEEYRRAQERVRGMRRRLREEGRPRIGGARAYGFESDGVTPRSSEQDLIRRSAGMVAQGAPLKAIARLWEAEGVRNSKGKPVAHPTIRNVLLHGERYGVDQDVARRVRDILQDDRRRMNGTGENRRTFLLTGLIWCSECGSRMFGEYRGRARRRSYRCGSGNGSGCATTISAEPLELALWRQLEIQRWSVSGDVPAVEGLDAMRDDLERLEARAANVRRDYADGAIDARTLRVALDVIEGQSSAVRRRLAEAAREQAARETVTQIVDRLKTSQAMPPFDEARTTLNAMVQRVTVLPDKSHGHAGPMQRVEVEWAEGLEGFDPNLTIEGKARKRAHRS